MPAALFAVALPLGSPNHSMRFDWPTLTEKAQPHSKAVRLLHALTGVLLIYGLIRNAEVTGAMETTSGLITEIVFATVLGGLFVWKYALVRNQAGGKTRLSEEAPTWERNASKIVHAATYIAVGGLILSGFAIAILHVLELAVPLRMSVFIHNVFGHSLMPLIFIHIAGALWHWLFRRDGVWQAMMSLNTKPY